MAIFGQKWSLPRLSEIREVPVDNDLFFLRIKLSDDPIFKGYRWSLQVVKVNQKLGGAYLSFRTHELASLFRIRKEFEVVAASELDENHYFDFTRTGVVLFESREDVERCLKDLGDFPYEQHLFRYDLAKGVSTYAA